MGVLKKDVGDDVERKSKKKKRESNASRGEDGDKLIDDEDYISKKIGTFGDTDVSKVVADVDCNLGARNSSRKDRKETRKNRIKKKNKENDSKRGKKLKKNKIRDALQAEDVSGKVESMGDSKRKKERKKKNAENVSEKVEPTEDRTRKKKKMIKKNAEDEPRAICLDKEFLTNTGAYSVGIEEDAGARGRKRKKKEKSVRSASGGTKACASDTEGNGAVHHAAFVETQFEIRIGDKMESENFKTRNKKKEKNLEAGSLDEVNSANVPSVSNEKSSRKRSSKKEKKFMGSNTEGDDNAGALMTNKRKNPIESSERSTPSKKLKVVRFSDQVEFLSLADNSRGTEKLKDFSKDKKKVGRLRRGKQFSKEEDQIIRNSEVNQKENHQTEKVDEGLIRGKRFSKEEDEIVKNSVLNYIEKHQLGERGLEMVLKCREYPEVRDCWKEIGKVLPLRPHMSVYHRAHVFFQRSESRRWTPEEIEEFYKKYGPDWRTLADELGKHRSLSNLVNMDLRLKAFEGRKTKHGILRDNISWEAISERLSTRSNALCCQKWYDQLTSPMVAEGIWADADDYRLIMALDELDASCLEDVDWDNLLQHWSGDVCRKRWNQMVRNIGEHGTKSFAEQVEILSKRYCLDFLEARVAYDSKTPVE